MLRARLVIAVCTSLLVALLAVPGGATVTGYDERIADAERRAGEAQAALDDLSVDVRAARDELVVLESRLDQAEGDLRRLEGQLALAEGALTEAEALAEQAARDAAAAAAKLVEVEQELATEEQRLKEQIVLAFMNGSFAGPNAVLELLQASDDVGSFAADLYRLGAVLDGQAVLVETVERLRGEQVIAVGRARDARTAADEAETRAADTVAHIGALRDEAEGVRTVIAADRARQATVLASLEADADSLRAVLASVEAEQEVLEAQRAAAVAAASRPSEPSGPSGPAGRTHSAAGTCPVDGARAGRDFSNDWGDPRSGGRNHEGTDIFADRGTPVRALSDGWVKDVRYTDTGLGGLYVSIWVDEGEHWYLAHLDSVAGGLAPGVPVSEGDKLGTVGNSGNARTTPPHLHIGHYVDDVAQNPYPVLAELCP